MRIEKKVVEKVKEAEREKELLPKANVRGRSRDLKKRQVSTQRRDEAGKTEKARVEGTVISF